MASLRGSILRLPRQLVLAQRPEALSDAILLGHGSIAHQSSGLELLTGGGCLKKSAFRVLVVDDSERWRNFISSALQKQSALEVIGRASDGLEAVHQAQDLQPDLILMDIGLPTLNGIEAARRIRKASPRSKILFVSENRSEDIAEAALSTGAGGYVVKSDAASELLPAVEAILQGKQFVSASLTGLTVVGNGNEHIEPLRRREMEYHEIKFHANYAALANDFAQFAKAALNNGIAVVIIATESLRTGISQELRMDGVGAERYFAYEISDPLSRVKVDDAVKAARQKGLHIAVG